MAAIAISSRSTIVGLNVNSTAPGVLNPQD